ncbi:bxdc1, partial [Symbiodinium microadriaticum]
ARLLKPNVKTFSRKNDIHPFDDCNSLEFLCDRNDCSQFIIGSHSKKRPHNMIMGRMYDGHLLDMVELGISSFRGIESFLSRTKAVGSKPVMMFLGDEWESDSSLGRVQNLFIDMFRGDKMDKLCLKGLDHVISFAIVNGKIMMRLYTMRFKKSGSK